MKPTYCLPALLVATLAVAPAAWAQAPETAGRWLVQGALDAGIDETIDSGGDSYRIGSTQSIGVGYEFDNDGDWRTRISLAYEFNEEEVGNTTNEFSVWPLELVFLYRLGIARVGFGAGYHIDPKYTAEIGDSDSEIEFDNAFSFVATVELTPVQFFTIGARFTHVEYGLQETGFVFEDGSQKDQLDARSIGVFALARF